MKRSSEGRPPEELPQQRITEDAPEGEPGLAREREAIQGKKKEIRVVATGVTEYSRSKQVSPAQQHYDKDAKTPLDSQQGSEQ